MSLEIELKLALAQRDLKRLASDPLMGGPGEASERLHALYFDTPRFSLWRRGISLRLRRESDRWLQCVKSGGSVEAGLHRRMESETAAASPAPDLSIIAEPDLRDQVLRAVGHAKLVPVFTTRIARVKRVVQLAPGVVAEASLDSGVIRARGARAAVSEVELELKAGPPWRLFEFALKVAERYAVRVEQRSKAERGYALARGTRPAPVRAKIGVVRPEMNVNEAFKAVCWACLNHMQSNHEGVLRDADPEYLHQMRVGLRRLRSLLRAFTPMFPEGALDAPLESVRWLSRALGPARDWDVFLEGTLAPIAAQFPAHPGLIAMQRLCRRLRTSARRAARRAASSPNYQRLVLSMGGWLGEEPWIELASDDLKEGLLAPAKVHAVVVLDRYHRRVRKRGRRFAQLDLPGLHRLRIAVKRLRYAVGFFAPLFARRRVRPMQDALNDMQDVLGGINDCATAPALIDAAARAARRDSRKQARAILVGWNAVSLDEHRRDLKRVWKDFQGCDPFWG